MEKDCMLITLPSRTQDQGTIHTIHKSLMVTSLNTNNRHLGFASRGTRLASARWSEVLFKLFCDGGSAYKCVGPLLLDGSSLVADLG